MTGLANDLMAPFEPPKGLEGALDVTTKVVFDNEPCFLLTEENRPSKSGKTLSRYQILRIVRNDRLVSAYIYLGPATSFTADQFQLLGGVVDDNGKGFAVHTVKELQEGADELRSRPPMRDYEPLPLQSMWQEQVDQRQRFQNRTSTFGHKGQLTR